MMVIITRMSFKCGSGVHTDFLFLLLIFFYLVGHQFFISLLSFFVLYDRRLGWNEVYVCKRNMKKGTCQLKHLTFYLI